MKYSLVIPGIFLERPNRFTAAVLISGRRETVHVKNTGRCRELLTPGAEVWLTPGRNPERKTKFDLIAVRKNTGILFNIDSQAPNIVVREWLEKQKISRIFPEYRFGESRIDFYLEHDPGHGEAWKMLLEVKGCTLERDGTGFFPDAPTERGVRHLHELTRAVKEGYRAAAAFVMQADGMTKVLPNRETHPEFAEALEEAESAGVQVLSLPCHTEPDSIEIIGDIRL